LNLGFYFILEITSISPSNGPQGGSTNITLSGTGLGLNETDIVSVTLGGTDCLLVLLLNPGDSVLCTTPPSQASGPVDVVITTLEGGSSEPFQWTYNPRMWISIQFEAN